MDVLVNNAGWSVPGFIATDTDRDKWQRTIEINLFTADRRDPGGDARHERGRRRSDRVHRQRRGIRPDPAGRLRRVEGGDGGIGSHHRARTRPSRHRSNVVCPGLVIPDGPEADWRLQPVGRRRGRSLQPKQIDFMLKDTPMRRLTTAEDIGRAVAWFSSPHAARQVTGQLISVSGGYTMP